MRVVGVDGERLTHHRGETHGQRSASKVTREQLNATPTCLVTELNGTRRRQSQPGSSVAPPRERDHASSALSVPFPPTTFGGAPTMAAGSNEASLQRMAPRTRRARAELSGDAAETESGRSRESRVMGLISAEEPSTTLTTVMRFYTSSRGAPVSFDAQQRRTWSAGTLACVSVPVLSEASMDIEPSVSTVSSFFSSTKCLSQRRLAMTVSPAARPSGRPSGMRAISTPCISSARDVMLTRADKRGYAPLADQTPAHHCIEEGSREGHEARVDWLEPRAPHDEDENEEEEGKQADDGDEAVEVCLEGRDFARGGRHGCNAADLAQIANGHDDRRAAALRHRRAHEGHVAGLERAVNVRLRLTDEAHRLGFPREHRVVHAQAVRGHDANVGGDLRAGRAQGGRSLAIKHKQGAPHPPCNPP